MQFNGINKLKRYNRYGSVGHNTYYRNRKNKRNDNKIFFNDGRLFEKSEQDSLNSEFPVLKNYFHDDNNNYDNNNYFG